MRWDRQFTNHSVHSLSEFLTEKCMRFQEYAKKMGAESHLLEQKIVEEKQAKELIIDGVMSSLAREKVPIAVIELITDYLI